MKELIEKQEEVVKGLQERLAKEVAAGKSGGYFTPLSDALHLAVEDLSTLKGAAT